MQFIQWIFTIVELVIHYSHWTNPRVHCRKGLQFIAWFDVLQENYKSDQLDTVQTAENMKTDVSLILLKQMLLPSYQSVTYFEG